MHQMNRCGLAVRLGSIISVAVLMAACQEPGHQGATAKSPVTSSQAAPLASTAHASGDVIAYTPPHATVSKPLTECNLEYVDAIPFSSRVVALKNEQPNAFKGWIDGSSFTQPSYWLRFDDPAANRYLQVHVAQTIPRPDVQAADADAPLVSGFRVNVPANSLPVGHYHVYLAVESDDTIYNCDNGRHIEIEP